MPSLEKNVYYIRCLRAAVRMSMLNLLKTFFLHETRLESHDFPIIPYLPVITIQGRIAVVYVNLLIFMLQKESYCDHNFYWVVHSPYVVAHFSAAARKIPCPIVLGTSRAAAYCFVDTNSYNNGTWFYTLLDSMLSSN